MFRLPDEHMRPGSIGMTLDAIETHKLRQIIERIVELKIRAPEILIHNLFYQIFAHFEMPWR